MADDRPRLRIGGEIRPVPLDPEKAAAWLADLRKAAGAKELPKLDAFLGRGGPDVDALAAILDLSTHLNAEMLQHPEWLEALFGEDARARIDALIGRAAHLDGPELGEAAMMAELRRIKRETCLLIALRDLFGASTVAETTADLSALAEAAIGAAMRFCIAEAHRAGKLKLPHPDEPERGCGIFVLGMGKLGAGELNYSSDVDLIVFFDAASGICTDPGEQVDVFSRLVRRLVRMIGERTADGYVFRTDLRLRPDPGAMPLAISTDAAMTYYEGSGRNWERAAMIKARPVAGDRAAGEAFLQELTPFVWRRYLDFAAIADIQAMKSRIDEHRGFDDIAVAGHNVKLGRGGIREVEFFVQAQQLIAGGRSPALRQRRTDRALAALTAGGWIAADTERDLSDDYWFLRRIEHCIQMVADAQTHTLPDDPDGLERIARLAGFEDRAAFSTALLERLHRVDRHFTRLFNDGRDRDADAPPQGGFERLLSTDDDPESLARLAELGYARPADIARIVRSWNYGRYRATRSEAARERLAKVMPMLLTAFADARDPDAAIAAFDTFLAGLPAGIQFFSLIGSNPRILDLLALIITSSPMLTETMAARPHVFDALLDPAFFDEVPDRDLMAERLAPFLADAQGYEDVLARLRIFASEQRFLVGARLLSGVVDVGEAGPAFSNIADVVLEATLAAVSDAFAERHGRVPGARVALLGMGRLGSRELTAGSDVDLILLYDHDTDAEESDGEKKLPAKVYFARLTQRLIAALTAPMREGVLYEVDFRLRPSGNMGPLATHIDRFRRYQEVEAWTWERMALTRSRPVAGDPALRGIVAATIESLLAAPRDPAEVSRDVASMRARIEREKPPKGSLDLKLRPGGLIDLEFLAQWALLTGRAPLDLVGHPTADVLAAADLGEAADSIDADLPGTMRCFTAVIQVLRLGPGGVGDVSELPPGLRERLARTIGAESADRIEPQLAAEAAATRRAFEALLPLQEAEAEPAGAAATRQR
ncbi:bifunctional [glutamine synthetase] adenylyltransferase/[glutamine synthetase]-adenylyl-L-tyrosine phosphorylase [Aurantimonas endophytica]|uniref:Bifunctional glutamine synthetase adenylyltransferase/adenylyl-removing enzyme n=1 Tax=Aurantimonas endophytica TaxID=1522175 RepID=A0A7W6HFU2_9HYPH|nr:bifunctional [glutamine synthetase] adenylyltransferase/[glutamine synthetase]-adenylyl-L-tyrosine phosphorylase [Aurantimonas endophytica]MBB4004231.1 glutamate-ammonia-ligase adenylyltransferase [Aurantimonas endophytica]MCO6405072.1 bifunctional [glutamine synthetase] adenylyltransferase/[glutamine synthetase]-adenylyl-L-tyrosine phosphorylase [Aurantimonas endophytica]